MGKKLPCTDREHRQNSLNTDIVRKKQSKFQEGQLSQSDWRIEEWWKMRKVSWSFIVLGLKNLLKDCVVQVAKIEGIIEGWWTESY